MPAGARGNAYIAARFGAAARGLRSEIHERDGERVDDSAVDGMTPLDTVKDLTGIVHLEEEEGADYHTLGGFIMARMHRARSSLLGEAETLLVDA